MSINSITKGGLTSGSVTVSNVPDIGSPSGDTPWLVFHHIQKSFLYWFNTTMSVTPQKTFLRKGKTKHSVTQTRVQFHLVAVFWKEFQSRKALDFDVFQLVCCRIHFGDDDVFAVLVFFPKFVPYRSQLLAMSTPRCICSQLKKNRAFASGTKLDVWDFKKNVDKEQPDKEPVVNTKYKLQWQLQSRRRKTKVTLNIK